MNDKQIYELIEAEEIRQLDGLELIPSENYVSKDVMRALGSVFTNKYSEGYRDEDTMAVKLILTSLN